MSDTSKLVQTRSEINGITFYETLRQAMKAADQDQSIWKISFDSITGERVRLVRDAFSDTWKYEPIF
jgi:hypothetical protein